MEDYGLDYEYEDEPPSRPCNFCMYQTMMRKAMKDGMKVTTLRDMEYALGGWNVFVHPPTVKIDKDNQPKEYFKAWFMSLPNHCCCD